MNCGDLQAYIIKSGGLGYFGARNENIQRANITEPNQLRNYLYSTYKNSPGFYCHFVD